MSQPAGTPTPTPAPAPPPAEGIPQAAQGLPGLEGRWQRLHPLSPLVRSGRGLIGLAVIVLISASANNGRGGSSDNDLLHAALLAGLLLIALVSWLVTRWRVEAGVLRVDSGLIRRTSERFPLGQIQAIDVVRPGLARVFGLSELRIRLAGGSRKAGRLAYLTQDHAERLRVRLLALGHGTVEEDAAAQPEQSLVRVPPGRLLGSLLLAGWGLALELAIAALIALAVLAPSAGEASAGGLLSGLIALVLVLFRHFNGGYRLTVSDAPDGLRVRSGLVELATETIRHGRIQAIRMTEPLLWRPLGWCRLEVDVAGQKARGRQDRNESTAVRALLPVGTYEQAATLLARVLPGLPQERLAPPPRARLKSPLRYRYLSWSGNERYAVTTSGRLRRVTDFVPLSKVQSIRRMEGPAQRALRLASVHLDTAGRNVHAVLRDRDGREASELLGVLATRARAARAQERVRTAS